MKKLLLIGVVLAATIAIIILLLPQREALSEQQLIHKVLSAYNGELVKSDATAITFNTTLGQYRADVTENGEIIQVTQLEAYKPPPPAEQKPEPPTQLTQEEAIAIAQQNFNGVLEKIDFIQNDSGGCYLIELENEQDEAELEIHAITGDVLSIVYDD